MTYPDDFTSPEDTNARPAELKDYFCPFCNYKLFRGHVKEFKMVCQECNRLVDSSTLNEPQPPSDQGAEESAV